MSEKKSSLPVSCAKCEVEVRGRVCMTEDGKPGKGCPTLTRADALKRANAEYQDQAVFEFAREASIQEAECYANRHQKPYIMQPTKTRIVEICEFSGKMNYKRLGLAFCVGLAREAAIVQEIFEARGFEVVSVSCKAGRTDKDLIGVGDEDRIFGRPESMCNPIFQAKLLDSEETDLNVMLGLCVGHDSLFIKYSQAPCTVLAVKDRVTGHNPLAAVYLSESYYAKVKHEL